MLSGVVLVIAVLNVFSVMVGLATLGTERPIVIGHSHQLRPSTPNWNTLFHGFTIQKAKLLVSWPTNILKMITGTN